MVQASSETRAALARRAGDRGRALREHEEEEVYVEIDVPEELGASVSEEPAFPAGPPPALRERAWEEFARRLEGLRGDPPPRRGRARRFSRLRQAAEVAACVGSLIALNVLAFPGDPGFREALLNPFFIAVLLPAIRFGFGAGLGAGLAAALWVYAAGGGGGLLDGGLCVPGLLVATAAFAGMLAGSQARRLAYFRSWSRSLEAERVALRRIVQARDIVVRDLQAKVEEQGVSMERLYRMSRGMGSGEPEQLCAALLEILARDLGARRASIYELRDGRLRLKAGWDRRPSAREFAPELEAEDGLPGLALRVPRPVSFFDPEAPARPGLGVLCGRIPGDAVLVVWIEEMPLLEFDDSTLSRFAALLRWSAEGRERAARLHASSGSFDRGIGAYTQARLVETLGREIARAQRYGQALRLVLVRMVGFEQVPERRRHEVRLDLSRILSGLVREVDSVCLTEREDTFALILPMYDATGVTLLVERVDPVFRRFWAGLGLRLSFAMADLNGHPVRPDQLLQEAAGRFPG